MLPIDREESPNPYSDSSNLRFPTIPVYGTPATWLSQSQLIRMASHHDDSSCDEASSSLGDSTYDFIDDRSVATTDDEGEDHMAESTASSEAFEPVTDPQHTSHIHHQTADAVADDLSASIKTPTYSGSLHESRKEAEVTQESIEFDEPSSVNIYSSRFIEASHILRTLPAKDLVRFHASDTLRGGIVTVRQTMTLQGLDLKGNAYKVMFVGDLSFKEPIVQKIGAAIAATFQSLGPSSEETRPTRFNIVPVSAFGVTGNPEVVLIDSSGLELTVEDCSEADFQKNEDGKDSLRLTMANGSHVTSSWTGESFVFSKDWTLPDLAVFCIPDLDGDSSEQTRRIARSFMNRHGVPSIVLSKHNLCGSEMDISFSSTLEYLTPHICLELQLSTKPLPQIKQRFPIDLTTFLNIDAGQMNRNLACLATSKRLKEQRVKNLVQRQGSLHGFNGNNGILGSIKSSVPSLSAVPEPSKIFATLAILCAGLFISFLPMLVMTNFRQEVTTPAARAEPLKDAVSSTSIQSVSVAIVATSPSSTSNMASISPKTVSSQITLSKSPSPDTDLAAFLLDTYPVNPKKADKFNAHVLGDCHIVLRPPHWFIKLRKTPSLVFKVSREGSMLDHTVSTLFDGVYALQIPREEAYGVLGVNVSTSSKPPINESFEVDFGSSWLKIAAWKRATRAVTDAMRSDLALVQKGLNTIYNQTKTELSTLVQQAKANVSTQKKTEYLMLASSLNWTAQTKDLMLAQMRDLSRNLSLRFQLGQRQTAKRFHSLSQDVSHSVSIYSQNAQDALSRQVRVVASTVTHLQNQNPVHRLQACRSTYLRAAQKKALRAWWSIIGVPQKKQLGGGGYVARMKKEHLAQKAKGNGKNRR